MSDALDTVRPLVRPEPLVIDAGLPGLPDFTPMFWRAKYLRAGPILHHVPFVFWVVDALRPRCVVTLGEALGVAHFAACQAVERLGLPESRCLLAAEWAGVSDRFDAIARHGHAEYREISEIRRQAPADAMHSLAVESIDLLVVDLDFDDASVDRLGGEWASRLAPGGVLLLHGGRARLGTAAGRAYLSGLDDIHAAFEFPHGDGLLVACPRGDAGERLRRLATLAKEPAARARIRQVFARLGQAHVDEIGRAEAETALDRTRSALRDAEARLCLIGNEAASGRPLNPGDGSRSGPSVARNDAGSEPSATGGLGAAMASALSRLVALGSPGGAGTTPMQQSVGGARSAPDAARGPVTVAHEAALDAASPAGDDGRRATETERSRLLARIAERDEALAEATRAIEIEAAKAGEAIRLLADLETERAQVARMTDEIAILVRRMEEIARERDAANAALASAESTLQLRVQTESEMVAQAEAMAAEAEARRLDHAAALARNAAALEATRRRLAERLVRARRADREMAKLSTLLQQARSEADVLRLLTRSVIGAGRSGFRRFVRNYRPHFGLPSVRRQIAMVRAAPEFDAAWYLKTYPDVASSGYPPAEHYVRIGAFEGRNPGPDFNTLDYYDNNREVARRGLNALAHHLVTRRAAPSNAAPAPSRGGAAVPVP